MEYITPPVGGDPDEAMDTAIAAIQGRVPGFDPSDGGLVTWLLEAVAQLVPALAETASETLTSDFRWFGEQLANVPVIDATFATGAVTITGTAGEVVPAGTHMYATVGDERIGFTNSDAATLTAGTATGVVVVADIAGDAGSDITGTLTLQDRYDFIDTITLEAATSGGVDGEEDDVYLDRLASRTLTFTDTPILPEDFSEIAKQVAGVWRSVAVDGFDPTDNEIESVTIDAAGGAWTFNPFNAGQVASGLAWNITAADFKTALEALSNIEPGDVIVTGGPGATAPLLVEWVGRYRNTNVATSVTTDTLTGGAGTATVATAQTVSTVYDPANTATWQLATVALVNLDEDGEAVTGATLTAVDVLMNGNGADVKALRETGFTVHVFDPTYTTIGATFTHTTMPEYDPADVTAAAEEALEDYLSPANWGATTADSRDWLNERTVRASEVYWVLNQVDGLRAVTALTLSGGTASGSDRILGGNVALPRAGVITGTAA